jgi:hypothetical protein
MDGGFAWCGSVQKQKKDPSLLDQNVIVSIELGVYSELWIW